MPSLILEEMRNELEKEIESVFSEKLSENCLEDLKKAISKIDRCIFIIESYISLISSHNDISLEAEIIGKIIVDLAILKAGYRNKMMDAKLEAIKQQEFEAEFEEQWNAMVMRRNQYNEK